MDRAVAGRYDWDGQAPREVDDLAYELESLETGQRMALHASDWRKLLGLAHRHGWRPATDLLDGDPRVIAPSEARDLADVLEGPLTRLPAERRQELRPGPSAVGSPVEERHRQGSETALEDHFAWQRRWIVEEAVRLCRRGAVEVRVM